MIRHPACVFDVETRSERHLGRSSGKSKSVGAERYARDPTTDILMLHWAISPKYRVRRWAPGDDIPAEFIDAASHGFFYYATNVPFDRAIWKHILCERYGWPYPGDEVFMDLAVMQCYYGLPRSVEEAAKALRLDLGKDLEGAALMKKLAKPVRLTKNLTDPWRHHTPDAIERLKDYCDDDVKVEALTLSAMPALPRYTRTAWRASERMNDRGIKIDRPFVHNAIHLLEVHRNKLRAEMAKITDGAITSETQGARLGELVAAAGIPTLATNKGGISTAKDAIPIYLDAAREKGLDTLVRVLELRQELNKSSVGKYEAMDRCALPCTDRLHGMWVFYGAHTGRWTGSLVQLQNLPKGAEFSGEMLDVARNMVLSADYEGLVWAFEEKFMTLMGALVRAALIPKPGFIFHVSDYSAVEGRGLAWLAGEDHVLYAYTKGLRLYCVAAAGIYKKPYDEIYEKRKTDPTYAKMDAVGKVIELACGYQGSVGAFNAMAKGYGLHLPEAEVKPAISAWRDSRPKTVALWYNTQRAAMSAIRTPGVVFPGEGTQGRLVFKMDGRHLKMRLPSGRILYYRNARIGRKTPPWAETGADSEKIEAIFYWGVDPDTKQWRELDTYGGKLVENAVQALCADLIYEALPRLEAAGFRPVGTVHDEILSEDHESAADIERFNAIMAESPAWADGFPIAAAGFTSHYYKKD